MQFNFQRTGLGLTFFAVVLLAAALVAFSQGPPGRGRGGDDFRRGPGGPGRDGLGPLARDLNLTDEQKTQIKAINDSFAESTKSLQEQMRALHQKEADPFTTPFDEAAVRAAAEARAKIDVELQVAHAKMMSQIGALLTDEQKAQLAARRQEHRPPSPPPAP